tara:strand:+ start:2136 stop:2540 length:405 start_codon:yes stop_codon:yes gene_type:complete
MDKVKLSKFKFQYSLNSRWKDLDAFGHVNNSTYLTYFEDARIELFNRWRLNKANKSLIVASIKIDYYRQILHPASFIIGQNIKSIGNKSFDLESVLFDENGIDKIAKAIITCVCFNYKLNKTELVYPEIIADLN